MRFICLSICKLNIEKTPFGLGNLLFLTLCHPSHYFSFLSSMSDAWEEIQAVKSKRNELRERLQKRRKEREDLLGGGDSTSTVKTDSTQKFSGKFVL
jgi:mRNA (2'-O-methyladenosine-N6-)-methyltransferase